MAGVVDSEASDSLADDSALGARCCCGMLDRVPLVGAPLESGFMKRVQGVEVGTVLVGVVGGFWVDSERFMEGRCRVADEIVGVVRWEFIRWMVINVEFFIGGTSFTTTDDCFCTTVSFLLLNRHLWSGNGQNLNESTIGKRTKR